MATKVHSSRFIVHGFNRQKIKKFLSSKTFYLALLIVGLALLITFKKSWFVAGMVNGSPISNPELLAKMNGQYRTQTLNQMVNEKIILGEARKNKIVISDAELTGKIAELEKNVGGKEVLDSLLAQQGQTRETLKDQIKLQLIVERLYSQEATVSAQEVQKFIEENKNQIQATTSAEQTQEATQTLKQQKLSQIFNQKFQELKKAAQITIF